MTSRIYRFQHLLSGLALGCGLAACDEPGGRNANLQDAMTDSGETSGTADSSSDTSGSTPVPGDPRVVDPNCVDGQYREEIPLDFPDVSGLVSAYQEANYLAFVDDLLASRYPLGATLVEEGNRLGGNTFGNCVTLFTSNRGSAQSLIYQLSTVVHECGHILDISRGGFSGSFYLVTEDKTFTCGRGDTTSRGGDTFARSLLNGDVHAPLLPSDMYRDVYLNGNPEDANFDGGDQGFNSVLEETVQYVNSLATDFYTRDFRGNMSVSARDGILTFLWYIERYLQMARTTFPEAYERLTTDACWREAVLTVWGRAWLYLEASRASQNLGINDDVIENLVKTPELLDEIARLREAHGCTR
jgi:hypothetical protein